MSCAYVFIRSRHGLEDARRRYESAARFSPIVPEATWLHELDDISLCAAFSNAAESAAGSYVHFPESGGGFVAFNGWVAGNGLSDQPFSTTVATWIFDRIQDTSFDDFVKDTTGEWSVLSVSPAGEIRAAMAFPGGEHIYYGSVDGVLVISNRAILCAAALHGHIPAPNPFFIGWLLTSNNAFLSDDETPFAHVYALHPLKTLVLHRETKTFELRARPWPHAATTASFDELLDEMAHRVSVVRRLPNVPFRLSLTGGRDSRLVLAALVAAKCFDKLRGCYLIAPPDHPDVIVGKMLAEHYGIPFECLPREASTRSIWEDLAIHHFQTEMGIHFWDSKGALSRLREGRLGGSYGEMFFSHFKMHQILGWPGAASVIESNGYVDPENVLTTRAQEHFRQGVRTFWQRRRDEGILPSQIRDRLHRDGRMWRWVGQGRLAIGLGTVNTNPIPSPKMLDKYLSLSYLDRRFGRIHYELMHRADPWIPEHPFASKGFSAYLTGHRERRLKFPPAARTIAPQHALWQAQHEELSNYLLAPAKGDFFELVDKKRLEQQLRRLPSNPSRLQLAAIFGIIGVRHALEEPIQPRPCKVELA
jgi:hypothetical protein